MGLLQICDYPRHGMTPYMGLTGGPRSGITPYLGLPPTCDYPLPGITPYLGLRPTWVPHTYLYTNVLQHLFLYSDTCCKALPIYCFHCFDMDIVPVSGVGSIIGSPGLTPGSPISATPLSPTDWRPEQTLTLSPWTWLWCRNRHWPRQPTFRISAANHVLSCCTPDSCQKSSYCLSWSTDNCTDNCRISVKLGIRRQRWLYLETDSETGLLYNRIII